MVLLDFKCSAASSVGERVSLPTPEKCKWRLENVQYCRRESCLGKEFKSMISRLWTVCSNSLPPKASNSLWKNILGDIRPWFKHWNFICQARRGNAFFKCYIRDLQFHHWWDGVEDPILPGCETLRAGPKMGIQLGPSVRRGPESRQTQNCR